MNNKYVKLKCISYFEFYFSVKWTKEAEEEEIVFDRFNHIESKNKNKKTPLTLNIHYTTTLQYTHICIFYCYFNLIN